LQIILFAQSKESLVESFLTNTESMLILQKIKPYGIFNSKECVLVQRNLIDDKLNILNFKIVNDDKIAGYLQVIQNGKTIFHQFISLSNYNIEKKSGEVICYDLKSGLKAMTMYVENDKLIKSAIGEIEYNNDGTTTSSKRNPLDTNGNGDVTFFECYKAVNEAIDADGFSSWVCDFPVLGWLSCWGSVSTACAIYSAGH